MRYLIVYLQKRWIYIPYRSINEHDKMDPLIWRDGSHIDPLIRLNSQAKLIFTDLERKGIFTSTKGKNG